MPTASKTTTPSLMVERTPIDKLSPDPANLRSHPQRNLDAIVASLKRFGQQKPIVVGPDNVVIAGNGTLAAARSIGWTHLDVVRTDLCGPEAIAYAIADNRTSDLSEFDDEALARTLEALRLEDGTILAACGFDDDELQRLLDATTPGLVDPDDVPAPPDEATTKRGDIYVLGEHRLMCGDSASPADVDRLLDGATIQLVNTDPPYNVKVEPRSNNAIAAGNSSFAAASHRTHHQSFDVARQGEKAKTTGKMRAKDRPLANDFVTDEAFDALLDAWFGNIARVLDPGRGFYVWGGYANLGNYPPYLKKNGLYFSQGMVWDKMWPVLTRKDFMGGFEIAFYGWREGGAHVFLGPSNAVDLWHVKKVTPTGMVHLTEKPVELATLAMQYSSRAGENVLDLFGGSGSTLIAAEQTGRRAFLMEIDTPYCDVIVERYERFAGKKAEVLR